MINHSNEHNQEFIPFDLKSDYLKYIDGKPRYQGVESFLSSRNICLPFGSIQDESNNETICGLGNKKDAIFKNAAMEQGIEIFESTVSLIKQAIKHKIRVGVATSSKNCDFVLKTTKLQNLFEAKVDGIISEQEHLQGKPNPDIFLRCAKLLHTEPAHCIVVEDAIVGVQAGKRGQFGLVIGIDRMGSGDGLKKNGADIVISDFANTTLIDIEKWFKEKTHA
jgi:HAD superfamily hydrolase (TIGR01509 family)